VQPFISYMNRFRWYKLPYFGVAVNYVTEHLLGVQGCRNRNNVIEALSLERQSLYHSAIEEMIQANT
jgi:hypothetical protein